MKKAFLSLGLLGVLFTQSFAQTSDLEIIAITPVDGAQLANMASGDQITVKFVVRNNGPDPVSTSTPNLFFLAQYDLSWATGEDGDFMQLAGQIANYNVANVGGVDTFEYTLIQGDLVAAYNQATGAAIQQRTVVIPNDANVSIQALAVGVIADNSGNISGFIDDPGVSAQGEIDENGNNYMNVDVTFGSPSVGIKDVGTSASLAVYPNPVSTTLNFTYEASVSGKITATITDIAGRALMTKEFGVSGGTQTFSMDASALSTGTYQLEVKADNGRSVSKFIVK